MKNLVVIFLAAASITANAADCSFKITQDHKINDCQTTVGRNCYTVKSHIVDQVAHALKAKGYTSEVTDTSAAAELEIDLAIASRLIPGRGIGYISVSFVDNNRNVRGNSQKTTGKMGRKRMFKKLNKLVGTFPDFVSSLVRSCP